MEIDIVCGMEVKATTKHKVTYRGAEFLFCSEECKDEFESAPEDYLD